MPWETVRVKQRAVRRGGDRADSVLTQPSLQYEVRVSLPFIPN